MKHIIGGNPPPEEAQVKTILVDREDAGQRLDNFLMRCLKGVPKTHVYRIIRSGEVRINKGRVAADRRIQAGDAIRLPPVRTSQRAADKAQALIDGSPARVAMVAELSLASVREAPARDFPILFEDDWLLAIDKPCGVAVHGGSGVAFGVIEQLRMARPQARFLELVHRLDRETSGILLLAKKRSALKNLQDQFRARETSKTYLALVAGQWPARLKVLDKSLQKMLLPDGERRVRVVAKDHPDAMAALSLVKIVRRGHAFTLLEVALKTGRTHQIRVHLASEGMPIAGDDKYGNFELNRSLLRTEPPLKRMFLHAARLEFKHPASGELQALAAALPPELTHFLDHAAPVPN
ncbi:MAG: RluA family pseudouridine synthase [Burkholderiaceae bacterium]